jgi:transcriptional regulator with XRE-family HTH domain
VIKETVGKRLLYLRKDLSRRLGEDLSVLELAQRAGLEHYTLARLENGLKGSTESLVTLVRYYRKQGYNSDWILEEDNQQIPMIVPVSKDALAKDLWVINDTLLKVKAFFDTEQEAFVGQLRKLGFQNVNQIVPNDEKIVLPDPI